MSSNIKVQRICQYCNNEFTARTTVTLYCSDDCAKKAYKARKRVEKVAESDKETQIIRLKPIEELKSKEFLTISEACKLLSVSRWTIWRAIKNNSLRAAKLGRRTLIRHADLEALFNSDLMEQFEEVSGEQAERQKHKQPATKEEGTFNIVDSYTLTEVQEKYRISETALHNLIRRHNIPKIKKGWFAYVPKTTIDNLLM
ncbi:MAG: helix-turn-helix domain-containing protein [Bacteroidetes bacterium]|nr:helix-turn-helix domain-containing protein [Bacteroidota bacterium]